MRVDLGKRTFIVEEDLIMLAKCFDNGYSCMNCPEYSECSEDFEFVHDYISKIEEENVL